MYIRQYKVHTQKKTQNYASVCIYFEMWKQVPHPKKIYKVIRHFYREFVFSFAYIASLATATAAKNFLLSSCLFSAPSWAFPSLLFFIFSKALKQQRSSLSYPRLPPVKVDLFLFLLTWAPFWYFYICMRVCVRVYVCGYELSSFSNFFCGFLFFPLLWKQHLGTKMLIMNARTHTQSHAQQKKLQKPIHKNQIHADRALILRHITIQMCDLTFFKRCGVFSISKTYCCCYYYCYVYGENIANNNVFYTNAHILAERKKTFSRSSSRLR